MINITINSLGTELTRDDRRKLFAPLGLLRGQGHHELSSCEDMEQVRSVVDKFPAYGAVFGRMGLGENTMLDKVFYEEEVKMLCLAFEQQFHYAIFYAYLRLREQAR